MIIFLENLNSITFEVKMFYYQEYDIWIIRHFLGGPNDHVKEGEQ